MATMEQLERALRNADAAGDEQAARALAAEIVRLRGQSQSKQQAQPSGVSFGRSFAQGLRDPLDAAAQIAERGARAIGLPVDRINQAASSLGMDPSADTNVMNYESARGTSGIDWGRMAGNMVSGTALMAVGPAATAATLPGRLGMATTQGAVLGALQPTQGEDDFWKQKAQQVGVGAGASAAMYPLTAGLSRLIRPQTSGDIKELVEQGVTPTPGQTLGGVWRATEEKAKSLPFVGDVIRSGEQKAVNSFNRSVFNRVLFPLGKSLPKNVSIGREAVQKTDEIIGQAYDDAISKIGTPLVDDQLMNEFGSLKALLRNVPRDISKQFDDYINNEIYARTVNGRLTGDAIKAVEQNLRHDASKYMRDPSANMQKYGEALEESLRSFREWMTRAGNPDAAQLLKKANASWAAFKRVQRAAAMTGADEGVFSPNQLQSAVKALDPRKDNAGFASGTALLQDMSEAGKSVLGNTVPNSGTADRALLAALLTGGIGGYLSPGLAALGIPAAMYTGTGQRLMTGLLSQRPAFADPIAQGARQLAAPIGAALTPTLADMLSQ